MHKAKYNHLELEINIKPKSPLLIKSGGISQNPSLPDMQFVRTFVDGMETVYIPGSSLKGVFRNYVEKILRTKKGNKKDGACEIVEKDKSCNKSLEEKETREKKDLQSYEIYKESCRACRLFGNTRLKSKISITDAYPLDKIKTETRYGVAISRLTHAVAHGPFDMEVAVSGSFSSKIRLENFELWQLGALAVAIKGFNEGLVRVGYGKSRGFGEVKANVVENIKFTFASDLPENEIWGIGKFVSDDERKNYDFQINDIVEIDAIPAKKEDETIYKKRGYSAEAWVEITDKTISKLKGVLQ